MEYRKVAVIGLGYIGLPTAAVLASRKIEVIGVDVQPHVVETINRGEIHIVEPDLDMVVKAAVNQGFLRASLEPTPADAFLIAVPTPFRNDHEPDLSYIEAAAKAIAPVLRPGNLVMLESTSPVGATEQLAEWMASIRNDLSFPQQKGADSDIRVAHCPERVLPGHVLRELVQNDRVIGGMTPACSESAVALYRNFVEGDCLVTDVRTAEMCKLTENSFRDLNIAFANELSIVCDGLGIDTWELIRLANHHPRVNILNPGPGVGGHCIAVDPWFIVSQSPDTAKLIRTARETNDAKPEYVARKIISAAGETNSTTVICLGASFKADIDDTRESPSIEVIRQISESGMRVEVVEPNIDLLPEEIADCSLVELSDAINDAEHKLFAILVAHKEFKENEELDQLRILDFCGAMHRSTH
jgi:UDP-N-acetyl-D-mannosaminuronic acid dehydrogenase